MRISTAILFIAIIILAIELWTGILVANKILPFTLFHPADSGMLTAPSSTITTDVTHEESDSVLLKKLNLNGDAILSLINERRVEVTLPSLVLDPILEKAAQERADDMAKNHYFSHETPDGIPFQLVVFKEFLKASNFTPTKIGENIAVTFNDYWNDQQLIDAWMKSPEHKNNILNGNFSDTGIGIGIGDYKGKKAIFIVQEFSSSDRVDLGQ